MKIVQQFDYVYYIEDDSFLEPNKVGKWMYFFSDKKFVAKICKEAVEKGIVSESKHSNANKGLACFYLNCDDMVAHKKVISFLIENNLIRRTKTGRLYNISFKLDKQTLAGEYGEDFHSEIKLEKFINLDTGKWLV
jgi:hypothetical protein